MNVFPDTDAEHAAIREAAMNAGADDCVLCTHHCTAAWARPRRRGGGESVRGEQRRGGVPNAYPRTRASRRRSNASRRLYRATGSSTANSPSRRSPCSSPRGREARCAWRRRSTPSRTIPTRRARPRGSPSHRRRAVQRGAGFVVPLVGAFPTIPGPPTRPAYYEIARAGDGENHGTQLRELWEGPGDESPGRVRSPR